MPLTLETRFGTDEVVSLLEAGGMGEVYRAGDRKLDRDVAITILAEAVETAPEQVACYVTHVREND
jgi:serine/threonine protein kinase